MTNLRLLGFLLLAACGTTPPAPTDPDSSIITRSVSSGALAVAECAIDTAGKGTLSVIRTRPAADHVCLQALSGTSERVGLMTEATIGDFTDASMVRFGGITLAFESTDTGSVLRVSIPTGPAAAWRRELWLDQIEEHMRTSTMVRVASSPRMNVFEFRVHMPGNVSTCEIVGGTPSGWGPGAASPHSTRTSATLALPREVFAGESQTLVWEVRCGPPIRRQ